MNAMPPRRLPPSPSPDIQGALLTLNDAGAALQRGQAAWNRSQLTDAIRSARYFLDLAEGELNHSKTDKP